MPKQTLIDGRPQIDRRTTLRWFASVMIATPMAACGESKTAIPWGELAPLTGPGYGRDPNLLEPSVPWRLTMTPKELATTKILADLILPADGDVPPASEAGVQHFINEWISAPYPDQQKDRGLIVPGLAWLDQEARDAAGGDFAQIAFGQQTKILDKIAFADRVAPGLDMPARFFARMRSLTLASWFNSPAGWRYAGYLGETPGTGDYAGPTPEALAHLDGVLAAMGLARLN